jgi:vitamin B12 transporter
MASQDSAQQPVPSRPDVPTTLLEEVVVTATRLEDIAAQLGSAYTKIDGSDLTNSQFVNVRDALDLSPSVYAPSSGVEGGWTQVSIRGDSPDHSLIQVDGVRITTPMNLNGHPFLSSANSLNLQDIEIIRGPHSVLYGSDAMGGVISIETKEGSGTPKATLFFEGGSYHSFREGLISDGSLGKLNYSLSYERDDTANCRPNNGLGVNNGSLRLDYHYSEDLTFGMTARVQNSDYQEPGSLRPIDYPNNLHKSLSNTEADLVSMYVDLRTTPFWTQRLTIGYYRERYEYDTPPAPENPETSFPVFFFPGYSAPGFPLGYGYYPPGPAYIAQSYNVTADWQNTFQSASNNKLLAGIEFLSQIGNDNTFSQQCWNSFGFYVEDQWEVIHNLTLTAGGRLEHHDLWGNDGTYRAAAAYLVDQTHTKLRTSFGTGFKSPTFLEVFSANPMYLGNPGLQPETSKTWDIGVDQYLMDDRLTLGATYFRSWISNLIEFQSFNGFSGEYVNRDKAEIQGIELSAEAKLNDSWRAFVAYTYIDSAKSNNYGVGMVRRAAIPRNQVALDTNYTFFRKLAVGAGISYVNGVLAYDFGTPTYPPPLVGLKDYALARIYGRYDVNERLSLTARIENLFSSHSERALGYPGLGTAAYGGIELHF